MKPFPRFASALLLGMICGGLIVLAADAPRDSLARLPEMIAAAIRQSFPDATVKDLDEREDDDERVFEVELQAKADRRAIQVRVSKTGEILDIDEDIPASELPDRVQRALNRAFPNAKWTHVEKESEINVIYRVDLETGGRKREVKLTRRGRIIEIEKK